MSKGNDRPRCMALTAKGDQCANRAKADNDYCGAHSGSAGRPTKLTRPLIDELDTTIRAGAFYEEAALGLGIGRSTLYAWRELGEADIEAGKTSTLAAQFVDTLTRASAAAEQSAAEAVLGHRFADWRAAAWYLERRNPGRWGRRDKVEHSGEVTTRTPELVEPDSDEAAAEVARILREAGAA